MIFKNRQEAGMRLAERLTAYRGPDSVVLALPRGGLPVALPIAEALGSPLDVIVAKKIGAPENEEFAIGAVTAQGHRVLNDLAIRDLLLPPGYLESKTQEQQRLAEERERLLRGVRPRVPLAGKIAILVDDGIATGMTVRAAIAEARSQNPKKVVVAAPVIAPDTLVDLRSLADEVVVLDAPRFFWAISQFYEDFAQVSDQQARDLLAARAR